MVPIAYSFETVFKRSSVNRQRFRLQKRTKKGIIPVLGFLFEDSASLRRSLLFPKKLAAELILLESG